MLTESSIHQNLLRHQKLLREAELYRKGAPSAQEPSATSAVLARIGDLLVSAGLGLQRRYRRMEQGVSMADYANSQRLGRAL